MNHSKQESKLNEKRERSRISILKQRSDSRDTMKRNENQNKSVTDRMANQITRPQYPIQKETIVEKSRISILRMKIDDFYNKYLDEKNVAYKPTNHNPYDWRIKFMEFNEKEGLINQTEDQINLPKSKFITDKIICNQKMWTLFIESKRKKVSLESLIDIFKLAFNYCGDTLKDYYLQTIKRINRKIINEHLSKIHRTIINVNEKYIDFFAVSLLDPDSVNHEKLMKLNLKTPDNKNSRIENSKSIGSSVRAYREENLAVVKPRNFEIVSPTKIKNVEILDKNIKNVEINFLEDTSKEVEPINNQKDLCFEKIVIDESDFIENKEANKNESVGDNEEENTIFNQFIQQNNPSEKNEIINNHIDINIENVTIDPVDCPLSSQIQIELLPNIIEKVDSDMIFTSEIINVQNEILVNNCKDDLILCPLNKENKIKAKKNSILGMKKEDFPEDLNGGSIFIEDFDSNRNFSENLDFYFNKVIKSILRRKSARLSRKNLNTCI